MSKQIRPDMRARIQSLTAAGRNEIEQYESRRVLRSVRRTTAFLQSVGAMALGAFSAGFAILITVVLLNILFHFIPS